LIVQSKKLFDYYQTWKNSPHDIAGVKCTDCHGGDPKKDDKDAAHKKKFISFRIGEKETFKYVPQICGRCHKEVLKHFLSSKHYEALRGKGTGPNCITCHGSMNVGIYKASEIGDACKVCHNEETNISPETGKVAEGVLHNINILRVYNEWLSNHTIFNEEKREKLVALYRDIVLSWHTFDFTQIEERIQKPLQKARRFTRDELADTKKQKYQKE
jgi:hypothetical protein